MIPYRFLPIALMSVILLADSVCAQGKKKTLDTLTTIDVRQQVANYLKEDKEARAKQAELAGLVQIKTDGLAYERLPPTVSRVRWMVVAVKLLDAQETQTDRTSLTAMLKQALGQHRGGIVE